MAKILIDEYELRSMVADAVNDAVDKITKKIAAKCAQASYNNEIFNGQEAYGCHCGTNNSKDSTDTYEGNITQHLRDIWSSGSCGKSGGCGVSSYRSYSGGCGSSGGC